MTGNNDGEGGTHQGAAEQAGVPNYDEGVVAKVAGMAEEGVFRHMVTFL